MYRTISLGLFVLLVKNKITVFRYIVFFHLKAGPRSIFLCISSKCAGVKMIFVLQIQLQSSHKLEGVGLDVKTLPGL